MTRKKKGDPPKEQTEDESLKQPTQDEVRYEFIEEGLKQHFFKKGFYSKFKREEGKLISVTLYPLEYRVYDILIDEKGTKPIKNILPYLDALYGGPEKYPPNFNDQDFLIGRIAFARRAKSNMDDHWTYEISSAGITDISDIIAHLIERRIKQDQLRTVIRKHIESKKEKIEKHLGEAYDWKKDYDAQEEVKEKMNSLYKLFFPKQKLQN